MTASIPQYLATLDAKQAKALKRVLALVRKAVPDSTPLVSYRMPAFKQDRVYIYCGAFARHVGIFPPVRGDARLQAALRPYANAKGNLRFDLDEPLPTELIARVAKALAKQSARPVVKPKSARRTARARSR